MIAPDPENAHRQEQIAFREFAHSGRINLVVVTVTTANESAESIIVRGTNLMETILAELVAQLGIAGRLIGADFDAKGPSIPDGTGAKRATFDFLITIDWRDSA